ncbi:MAG: hypothetical protein Ct9H300mP15_13550 [Gemmatimonadota bacterium]|nr:MAG: hypothetical protein Ct9H300mP15_13550 [Gemmatimonadota bacterium]
MLEESYLALRSDLISEAGSMAYPLQESQEVMTDPRVDLGILEAG